MKKGHIMMTLTLTLIGASVAWAQTDQNPPAAPPPAPAFGQENPVPAVSENPPISAIDQPGLEPHAAPESFLLPGLHFSESADSNPGDTLGGSSFGAVTRGLGSLTLQKLWKNYAVAMDYIGGVVYDSGGVGLEQLQQFDMDNRINWKRGQLAIRDSVSYLPEGTFGFSAYGGSGAYDSGLGSLGSGMLGSAAFGGQASSFTGGNGVSVGEVPRLLNLGLADIVENLTPKSSVTLAAGYGVVHFYGALNENSLFGGSTPVNVSFVGSSEVTAQVGYDRILNPRDQVALSYGYQGFDFSVEGTAFHSNVIQAMYGHRISGRMDFLISAGPQFTLINLQGCTIPGATLGDCTSAGGTVNSVGTLRIGVAGRISLRYKFPRTMLSLSGQRYDTSGSGLFAGAETNIAQLDAARPLTRVWDMIADLGYAKNTQLQLPGAAVSATSFSYGYAGVAFHRQFGRNLRGFVSYQFNELGFNTACPLSGSSSTGPCSHISQRQVGTIGLDWTPRPIRLD